MLKLPLSPTEKPGDNMFLLAWKDLEVDRSESIKWTKQVFLRKNRKCEMGEGFFFPLSSAAPMEMSLCAATDVRASTVVRFLFVEHNQK